MPAPGQGPDGADGHALAGQGGAGDAEPAERVAQRRLGGLPPAPPAGGAMGALPLSQIGATAMETCRVTAERELHPRRRLYATVVVLL